ncbi:alpha/beta hydrolase [Mycolicibacterium acapulense]|nr:alpha/beta hydrolase [Mycolicibacterium acapulense]KUI06669.1 alpha/beta hydrolase [Mycolicibacterium acapulense]KUI10258.1 alpha/beta hydrolase [Mycolicibacterium acapulense]
MLEVIDKGERTAEHQVPLLFVHGGCHAAWCWDEHFLDYFAEHGFQAVAASWRGHGGSALSKPLAKCSMNDYLDDVRSVADRLDRSPVLIGHSTGGFLVQKYLEERSAPAGVLMASTPPQGILRASMRVWLKHPWVAMRANTFGQSHEIFNTPALARDILFSPHTPGDIVASCANRVEPDSMRAVFFDQLFGLPDTKRITTPLLVLGGEDDGLISNEEVRATARAYNTEAVLFPRIGHNMMVDAGWREVADHICNWLRGKGL